MHDTLEPRHHMIDYVKFALVDPQAMRAFREATHVWSFEWCGLDYVAFRGAGVEGGVYHAEMESRSADGGTLIVVYSRDLEVSEALVLCPTGQTS